MTTWYAKVESWNRFGGPTIEKRKVELDGWMDDIEMAILLIGTFFNRSKEYRDPASGMNVSDGEILTKLRDKYTSLVEFNGSEDAVEYYADIKKFSDDRTSGCLVSEEWMSGVATSKEVARDEFDKAKEELDCEGCVSLDEW